MSAKVVFAVCIQALLVQSIYSQCPNLVGSALAAEEFGLAGNALVGNALVGNALAGNALAYGAAPLAVGAVPVAGYAGAPVLSNPYGFVPTSGGSFAVQSMSPIAPIGIRVASENAIEGALSISGGLPFLGAVAVDGVLPTAGAGGINYGCGNGAIGIMSENINLASVAPAGPGYPGMGYNGMGAGMGYGAGRSLGYGIGGCGAY